MNENKITTGLKGPVFCFIFRAQVRKPAPNECGLGNLCLIRLCEDETRLQSLATGFHFVWFEKILTKKVFYIKM